MQGEEWNYEEKSSFLYRTTMHCSAHLLDALNRFDGRPSISVTYSTTGSSILPDDTYYINNKHTGKYLKYNSSAISCESGKIGSLGASIRWQVRHVDGGWVIRAASDTTKYLGVPVTSSSNSVVVVTVSDGAIPDRCKWTATISSAGGVLLKNVANAKYLYSDSINSDDSNEVFLRTSSSTGTSGTSAYYSRSWRCFTTSSSLVGRELTKSYSVNPLTLKYSESAYPTINKSPSDAIWADRSDFIFSTPPAEYLTKDSNNMFTAKKVGSVTVTATHKVTNLTATFTVTIKRYNLSIGLSTDNYDGGCRYGTRGSKYYGEEFCKRLTPSNPNFASGLYITRHDNGGGFQTASKNDFSYSSHAGDIANNVDLMIYIGHGIKAKNAKGNYLHYNYTPNGASHTSNHQNDDFNLYTSEAKFGANESKLRWVWLYSCNFLTPSEHVTDDSLRQMMNGAHIVMGYASTAFLFDTCATIFAQQLSLDETIIDSFFKMGTEEYKKVDGKYVQRVLCIPEAYDETIYSLPKQYSYSSSAVIILDASPKGNSAWD